MPKSNRSKLIHELLKGCDQEFSDEELMHLLTEQKITANTNHAPLTFGQKPQTRLPALPAAGRLLSVF